MRIWCHCSNIKHRWASFIQRAHGVAPSRFFSMTIYKVISPPYPRHACYWDVLQVCVVTRSLLRALSGCDQPQLYDRNEYSHFSYVGACFSKSQRGSVAGRRSCCQSIHSREKKSGLIVVIVCNRRAIIFTTFGKQRWGRDLCRRREPVCYFAPHPSALFFFCCTWIEVFPG